MKFTEQVQPIIVHPINRSEALMPKGIIGEVLQVARAAIVVELRIGLEPGKPSLRIVVLQCLNRTSHRVIGKLISRYEMVFFFRIRLGWEDQKKGGNKSLRFLSSCIHKRDSLQLIFSLPRYTFSNNLAS